MCKYRGFSLVELIIVIAIIATLATIALPIYKRFFDKVKINDAFEKVQYWAEIAKEAKLDVSRGGRLNSAAGQSGIWPNDSGELDKDYILFSGGGSVNFANISIRDPKTAFGPIVSSGSIQTSTTSTCNYFYIQLYIDPTQVSNHFKTGDYMEFEFGETPSGRIESACTLWTSGGTVAEPGYFHCNYDTWQQLESASGGKTCP